MFSKKATAGILSIGLAVILSGCTNTPNNSSDVPVSEPSSLSTTSPNTEPAPEVNAEDDAQAVATTYEDITNGVFNIDATDYNETITFIDGQESLPSDETQQELVNMLKEAVPEFSKIDVEGLSLQEQVQSYGIFIFLGAFLSDQEGSDAQGYSVSVPEEAVTVTDQTATIDVSQVVVSNNGTVIEPTSSSSEETLISFIKKDGQWLVDSKKLLQAGS
jgi:hypothetical protein